MIVALIAAGLGVRGFSKFKKTPLYKRTEAQVKADPVKTAPDSVKAEKINEGTADNPFIPPSRASQAMRYAKEFVSDALVPLSRKLKNISPQINAIFRQHERHNK